MDFTARIKKDGQIIVEVNDRKEHLCTDIYKVTANLGKQLSDEELPDCPGEVHQSVELDVRGFFYETSPTSASLPLFQKETHMSHRVTVQTKLTEKSHVITALNNSNMSFREDGALIHVTSGPMNNATINTKTGEISGDSDFKHTVEKLGVLRQAYSLAMYEAEMFTKGGTISSVTVDNVTGDLVLACSLALVVLPQGRMTPLTLSQRGFSFAAR